MKKKRLLAIFAAFAVAATMAIGFTACEDNTEDKGDGTHTEQPGDNNPENPGGDKTDTEDPENPENPGGDNTDPENPNNPGGDNTDPENPENPGGGDNTDPENPENPGGDNTDPEKPDDGKDKVKMTEAEWKKAIANSIAATSYSMTSTSNSESKASSPMFVEGGDGTPIFASSKSSGEFIVKYDGVNGVVYHYDSETVLRYENEKLVSTDKSAYEWYYELIGSDVISYGKSDSSAWRKQTDSYATKEEAMQNISQSITGIDSFLEVNYKIPGTDEEKPLDELFEHLIYDKNANSYTVNVILVVDENHESPEMTFTIKFSGGKIYSIEVETSSEGSTTHNVTVFTDYNSTVVAVPQEVKEEASANGGNQNPDNPGGGDHTEPSNPDNPPHGGQDDPAEEAGYIGTYMFYSLTVDGAEYLAGETFALNGMDVELTSDFMVIELKEGGVAEVTMSMGGMSETISCSWEKAAKGVIIYMNGDSALFYTNGLPDCLMMDGFLGLPDAVGTFKKI